MFVCFLFEQKTAYEVRISDWSSDVCSSDLVLALLPVGQRGLGVAQGVLADAILFAQLLEPRLRIGDGFLQYLQARLVALDVLAIGRASCRARVCQSE